MASKSKSKSRIKKYQSEVENRVIDLQRFAYDVFTYSAMKFDIPESCIRRWEGEENDYGHSDFILVLSRMFLKYQITERCLLYRSFKSRYALNKFQSFDDILHILRQVLSLFVKKVAGCVLHEVIISLSVMNEMIIFLYSENCNLYLKELSRFWYLYVSHMKHKFEKAGGLAALYEMHNTRKSDFVDAFYDEFIPGFCFPYDDPTVLDCLHDIFHEESRRFFKELVKDLAPEETAEYSLVILQTLWRDSMHIAVSVERERVDIALRATKRDKTSELDIPENTGLGIPQHESHYDSGVPEAAGASSPNLAGPSCEEPSRRHRRLSSKERRQKWRSDSRSSVEKDSKELNLDSTPEEE